MVSLSDVQSSNAQITNTLPAGLVAVFVGATNGIGEAALKEFARSTRSPRAYFIGRSQEAAARITAECRQLNPEGEFTFIKADVSLIRNVDSVCRELQSKEKTINILFLSCGTLRFGEGGQDIPHHYQEKKPLLITQTDTSEGLHLMAATGYYARTRFIVNLLPNLKQATGLRRVVSVLAGGHEGPIDVTDFQGKTMSMINIRGHLVSMTDMALETLAEQAPEVTFINDYPGTVKTGIGREPNTLLVWIITIVLMVIGPLIYIPIRESGERHLFFATSAKYPPRIRLDAEVEDSSSVPLSEGVEVASGTDGKVGSGVYSIHWSGEHAGPKVVKLLAGLREEGMAQKVWQHTVGEFDRIVGSVDI
ncbi:unnamed protein product [Penicillium nalgiovense]|uniref:Uncharacterized protein n=1 Tax=Penicillium nalgiovense TaxID=60175 RepID=A0A1V6YM57_PENNA|nr:hypothetical protein PENNAL_c0017G11812 [Penicillium nalgiovense]CAG7935086.1 unnamed protein product [Penicillium nalgiovense]CAG7938815.1 unnamed protein product [Penicillium nalgiovense]CAG8066508.1 unnamed protein product [Penicillium nalgiovense]CAG8084154.1 unnamed protein product [Penicillium nalgiovense]